MIRWTVRSSRTGPIPETTPVWGRFLGTTVHPMTDADPLPDHDQHQNGGPDQDRDGGPDQDREQDLAFLPWDGRRVPVTLLGGYLGAGKTTVINELLARTDQPIAVLVNDVGKVNVDASLIRRRHGDTIELTDGCVCCSLSQGLVEAFDNLRTRTTPPDHVILELSGVAEPSRVVPFARSDGFRLDGVVVLVDADQFLDRLQEPVAGPMIRAQIRGADLFVLTKTDLVDADQQQAVVETLTELSDGQPILDSASPLATAGFLNTGTRSPRGYATAPPATLFDGHVTSVVPLPQPISLAELEQLVDELDPQVLRAKAVVATDDGKAHLVQVVGKRRLITPLPAAEAEATTDLVVITAGQPAEPTISG